MDDFKIYVKLNFFVFLITLSCLPPLATAKKAPSGMTEFNQLYPTPAACDGLNTAMEGCKKKNQKACTDFVAAFKNLLPEYDCQRSFDSTQKEKYVVPAIWLCDDQETFLGFLSKMKAKDARRVFGSEELRNTLDGNLAEQYLKKSLLVSKANKK